MFTQKDRKIIFELRVIDIFSFEDGRTLFLGELFNPVQSIGKCLADILVDGHCIGFIEIEGSWMQGPKQLGNPLLKTVSTLKKIDKNTIPFKDRKVVLVGYDY